MFAQTCQELPTSHDIELLTTLSGTMHSRHGAANLASHLSYITPTLFPTQIPTPCPSHTLPGDAHPCYNSFPELGAQHPIYVTLTT